MLMKYKIKTAYELAKLKLRLAKVMVSNLFTGDLILPIGRLRARVYRVQPRSWLDIILFRPQSLERRWTDMGLISTRVVTTAGVNYIVDAFQNTTELENMKYHGVGTGTNAEAVGDTALQTEVETRATGTTTEGASANIYRTVGTVSITATRAITEHGIFSASSVGTLLDRSQFSAINVVSGDSIEFTYDLTFPAGS